MAKRRTLQETRQLLLDAGKDLVQEFDLERGESTAGALAHIRAADVAARAGLSKGMVYHLWADQEDYRHDLLIHVAAELTTAAPTPDPGADTNSRDFLNQRYQALVDDPGWRLFLEMCAYANDPAVRVPLQQSWDAQLELLTETLAASLKANQRELRNGIELSHFVKVMQAVDTGFRVMGHVDTESFAKTEVEVDGDGGWTLYATTVQAVFDSLTVAV